jgi:hypothetical protein
VTRDSRGKDSDVKESKLGAGAGGCSSPLSLEVSSLNGLWIHLIVIVSGNGFGRILVTHESEVSNGKGSEDST